MAQTPLLEVRQLTREIAGAALLQEISLSLANGESIAIIGPSGAGKSLLLRAMALLDPIAQGEIFLNGQNASEIAAPEYRAEVIYLHQRPFLPEGTVEEALREPFTWHVHRTRQFDCSQIVSWLQRIGRTEAFLQLRIPGLSGGESQIASILRAMQLQPRVLLLDEPTSALDPVAAEAVEHLVQLWRTENTSPRGLVWVSHDPQQAARMCDRQLRVENGRLAAG